MADWTDSDTVIGISIGEVQNIAEELGGKRLTQTQLKILMGSSQLAHMEEKLRDMMEDLVKKLIP